MADRNVSTMSDLLRTRLASGLLLVAFGLEAFLVSPCIGMGLLPLWVGALSASVTLLAAAIAVRAHRRARGLVLAILLFALAAHWGHLLGGSQRTQFLLALATAISCATFAALFLIEVFSEGRVGSRLLAVLSAYLFMGAAWGGVYHIAELLWPGAFTLPAGAHPGSEFLYYSFATITSVGSDDIIPVNPLVRSLTVLEAMTGQLYLVLVVSRFVAERGGRDRTRAV
ncbi:MAG: potassium channel family protein [Anaeromyxobacteraceae bacterium]